MTEPAARPASTSAARGRTTAFAGLVVLGAAAAAAAAATTWWSQDHLDSLAGTITTRATGSRSDPVLVPVALVALAGFGAALATGGLLRRSVGGVLLVAGTWAAVPAVIGFFSVPDLLHTDLTRPVESSGTARLHPVGPSLALLGGLLVAVAGMLLLAGVGARRALGTRFDGPTGPGGSAGRRSRSESERDRRPDPANDPDASAGWWKALDAGQDPTAANGSPPDGDSGAPPGPGVRSPPHGRLT